MSLVFGMLICMNEKNKAGFFLLEEDGESLAHQKICSLARLETSPPPPPPPPPPPNFYSSLLNNNFQVIIQ